MNKPAAKEPSMDEILSSIRQIIADDDATAASPRRPAAEPMAPAVASIVPAAVASEPALEEPLTLSAEQILSDPDEEAIDFSAFAADEEKAETAGDESGTVGAAGVPAAHGRDDAARKEEGKADLVDPEDVVFELEEEGPAPERVSMPISLSRPLPPMEPLRPRPSAAQAAPMPDPKLSSDIADELLEPTTGAAVRANFAKLNNLGLGAPGLTLEAVMREMLRPMLKEWLDEHLPAVVERMVEKEIGRISRGLD